MRIADMILETRKKQTKLVAYILNKFANEKLRVSEAKIVLERTREIVEQISKETEYL